MSDSFLSIETSARGFFKAKGSKFHAVAIPVSSVEQVKDHLTDLKQEYHDARHHCYAYRIGIEGEIYRANDDGEPAHSAGTPILNAIRSKELSNVVIFVIRYFGGTKLGIPGLIEAYGGAADDAIVQAKIVSVTETASFSIRFQYEQTAEVERIIARNQLKIINSKYDENCLLTIEVPKSKFTQSRTLFENLGILD